MKDRTGGVRRCTIAPHTLTSLPYTGGGGGKPWMRHGGVARSKRTLAAHRRHLGAR